MLYPTSLSGFSDLYYTFAALNNDIRFVGFPREDGSSGNAFNASCTLSISTTCKDKSGRKYNRAYRQGKIGAPKK